MHEEWLGDDQSSVIPESIDVAARQARRKHTGLRPEYPDACLNLWLLDRAERYRRLTAIHSRQMKAASRAAFARRRGPCAAGFSQGLSRPAEQSFIGQQIARSPFER